MATLGNGGPLLQGRPTSAGARCRSYLGHPQTIRRNSGVVCAATYHEKKIAVNRISGWNRNGSYPLPELKRVSPKQVKELAGRKLEHLAQPQRKQTQTG
jgi:hypothetical protein